MYFRADDKKLLEKYKAVFTKIEYLKDTELNALLVYKNKYYFQVYLENCASRVANKRITDYLDENLFEVYVL